MVYSYATWSLVPHSAGTSTMAIGICEFLNLIVEQVTAAAIRQTQTEVTNLIFAALDEKITTPTPTIQKSHLLRPLKSKRSPAPGQQDPQVCDLRSKPTLPQDWN